MPKARFTGGRSRQQNERMIFRRQHRFDGGMQKRRDRDPANIDASAVAELRNARGHRHFIEGRGGCEQLTAADITLTLPIIGSAHNLGEAMNTPDGELYLANDSTIPAIGDIFATTTSGDFLADTALATAKGENPRNWDLFEVTDNSPGTEAIDYLGNMGPPPLVGWGDTQSTLFDTAKSGDEISRVGGPLFTHAMVGNFWVWGDGTSEFIIGIINDAVAANRKLVVDSTTVKAAEQLSDCYIAGPLLAQLFHRRSRRIVAQYGRQLYTTDAVPMTKWNSVILEVEDRPADAEGFPFEEGDDAILINKMADYRVKVDTDEPYAWCLNAAIPLEKGSYDTDSPNTANYSFEEDDSHPHLYDYLHSLTRFRLPSEGRVMDLDRTDVSKGMVIEQETGSTKIDGDGVDYTEIATRFPVGSQYDSSDTDELMSVIKGLAPTGVWVDYRGWEDVADGTWRVEVGSSPSDVNGYDILTDLTGVQTLAEAAARMQASARVYPDLQQLEITYGGTPRLPGVSTDRFYFVWPDGRDGTHLQWVKQVSSPYGTDISGAVSNSGVNANGVSPVYYDTMRNNQVRDIAIPGFRGATHLTQWRTKSVSKNGIALGNMRARYVWDKDVPLCKAFSIDTDSGTPRIVTVNSDDGYLANEDFGSLLSIWNSGTSLLEEARLDQIVGDPNTFTLDPAISANLSGETAVVGSDTFIEASQTDTTVTLTLHKKILRDAAGSPSPLPVVDWELTDDDVGKPFFWSNGQLSWVRKVLTTATFEAFAPADHAAQPATMDPTTRSVNDDVDDLDLERRRSSLFLKNRYWEPLPVNGIGQIIPGFMVVAEAGQRMYYYSESGPDNGRLLGYYHPGGQLNDKLNDVLVGFERQQELLVVKTKHGAYRVNTQVAYEFGDPDMQERPLALPDPEPIDDSIGFDVESGRAPLENGAVLVVTNEKGVRALGASEFSDNYAAGAIQESELNELGQRMVLAYDRELGAIAWGRSI